MSTLDDGKDEDNEKEEAGDGSLSWIADTTLTFKCTADCDDGGDTRMTTTTTAAGRARLFSGWRMEGVIVIQTKVVRGEDNPTAPHPGSSSTSRWPFGGRAR